LGRIRAVVPDRSGGLIVLDELMLEVRRYGPDGGLIARAGRGGSGPGEFRAPADIALDRAGNVHVLDPARGRISVLQSDEREGYRPLRDIRTSVPGYAFCMMDDEYIVVSPEEDAVLHRLSSDGRVLRSFAKPLAFSEGEALDELSEV